MNERALLIAVVDDHRAVSAGVQPGLSALLTLDPAGVYQAQTVSELLAVGTRFDVVLLDLQLNDGTDPEGNVQALLSRGWPVLLYTQETRAYLLGRCLRAGALGVVGKHATWSELATAVNSAVRQEPYLNPEWANAMEACLGDEVPELATREAQVLRLYAAGMPMKSVARRVGIAEETAKEYLARIRRKYALAGRAAPTKTDLYVRAVEDGHLPGPTGPLPRA
ncbi:MAG: response regulator transcription factor [Propionicimonas sp.]